MAVAFLCCSSRHRLLRSVCVRRHAGVRRHAVAPSSSVSGVPDTYPVDTPPPAATASAQDGSGSVARHRYLHDDDEDDNDGRAGETATTTLSSFEPQVLEKGRRGKLARGSLVLVRCESLAYGGKGVCRLPGGQIVLVKDAFPGEHVTCIITSVKKGVATGRKVLSLSRSDAEAESLAPRLFERRGTGRHAMQEDGSPIFYHDDAKSAPCRHYYEGCGGCGGQALTYNAQLQWKTRQLIDSFMRIGGFDGDAEQGVILPFQQHKLAIASSADDDDDVGDEVRNHNVMRPIVGATKTFRYRNKMEFSFSNRRWRSEVEMLQMQQEENTRNEQTQHEQLLDDEEEEHRRGGSSTADENEFALGLHAPQSFSKVLSISQCLLQDEMADAILSFLSENLNRRTLRAYDELRHTGYLRHLVIRKGSDEETDEKRFMIVFTTVDISHAEALRDVASELVAEFGKVIASVIHQIAPAGQSRVHEEHTLIGESVIYEKLGGVSFAISASSFFQTNTEQARILYDIIAQAAGLPEKGATPTDFLVDLFCGTGSIGLSLASRARRVVGIEIVPEAVRDAERNAERNGITNARFICGDLNKIWNDLSDELGDRPDVVIVNPARPGCHPKLVEFLNSCGARRIAYISCNHSTQARDLANLCGTTRCTSAMTGNYVLRSVTPGTFCFR